MIPGRPSKLSQRLLTCKTHPTASCGAPDHKHWTDRQVRKDNVGLLHAGMFQPPSFRVYYVFIGQMRKFDKLIVEKLFLLLHPQLFNQLSLTVPLHIICNVKEEKMCPVTFVLEYVYNVFQDKSHWALFSSIYSRSCKIL